jgi:pimeloyl-ACP methyl ester carboxylesterase
MSSPTKVSMVTADGVEVFYRSAGSSTAPVVLLLHGFPSSSHMFRNLIPLLASKYYVIAPDLPGFGFTVVPASRNYKYTFASIAQTTAAFLDVLNIKKFAVYIFDYGAPIAFRLALERPDAITALVTQNGNAYVEGLGKDFWAPIQQYWTSGAPSDREAIRTAALNFDTTKWQYTNGSPHPDAIPPESYYLDTALMARLGNEDIQLDMIYDYRTNVELYPRFQAWLRDSQVKVLAVWGKNDPIFVKEGAEAFRRDVGEERLRVGWFDAGHFALETNEEEMAGLILGFLGKFGI